MIRRKVKSFQCAALFLLLFGVAGTLRAQNVTVRGRLYRVAYGRQYPVPYIAVTVINPAMGRSSPSYTDANGMYYLFNVPQGYYTLEVWWSRDPRQAPFRYNIVVNNFPYTDIAPIQIP